MSSYQQNTPQKAWLPHSHKALKPFPGFIPWRAHAPHTGDINRSQDLGYKPKVIPVHGRLSPASPCVSAAALSITALDIMALCGNSNTNALLSHHTIPKEPPRCYWNPLKSLSPCSLR